METSTTKSNKLAPALFLLIGIVLSILLFAVDEGVQGFNNLFVRSSLIEISILVFAFTLTLSIFYGILKRKTDSVFPFITTIVFGLPISYIVYLFLLYIFSILS